MQTSWLPLCALLPLCASFVACSGAKTEAERIVSPDDSASLLYNVPDSLADRFPSDPCAIAQYEGYELVWHEEFSRQGTLSDDWTYEQGFVRNEELQWYQPNNATLHDGCLDIEGREEIVENDRYEEGHPDWRRNRPHAEFTSACVTTQGTHEFMYGRFEVRAKIPAVDGSWPAIWLLGNRWGWPECGEIDVMEYYISGGRPSILANACWGGTQPFDAVWDSEVIPYTHFLELDPEWGDKFHLWRLDWEPEALSIYLDDELLNVIETPKTVNGGVRDNHENPFCNEHEGFGAYILLNLALGGNGGTPDRAHYPLHYLVDYVRVYQRAQQ